ncbi:MAG: Ig domain-containing protein [Lachnospiraceae bacterium]|nr:Ig domain-containing protein [Lachnospiraceae bacterium]
MKKVAKRIMAFMLTLAVAFSLAQLSTGEAKAAMSMGINYRTYVQKEGWQSWVNNGAFSGTKGKGYRLETIQIKLNGLKGGVSYRTYVQKKGWQNWAKNGEKSGTTGQGLRLEAIQIKLTGDATKKFDVYYRVYAQSYGWLGWAKNGASAGTSGLGLRLEGIQIKLVAKGNKAPTSTEDPYVTMRKVTEASVPEYEAAEYLLFRFQNTTNDKALTWTYDYTKPDTSYFGIMYSVLGSPSVLGIDTYCEFPVFVEKSDEFDPQGKFMDDGYWMISIEDYEWICKNVLNMSDANIKKMNDVYNASTTYYNSYKYYSSYIVSSSTPYGELHCPIEVTEIRTDGRYYYFDYELFGTDYEDEHDMNPLDIRFTAKMKLKTYNNKKYWSVYSVKRR